MDGFEARRQEVYDSLRDISYQNNYPIISGKPHTLETQQEIDRCHERTTLFREALRRFNDNSRQRNPRRYARLVA